MTKGIVTVERFTGAAAEWDAFVRQQAGYTHYHLHGWRDVMRESFRHATPYLAARTADGALAGVLPLVGVESLAFGRYLMSMPFLNYGGPLGTADAVIALTDVATELATTRRAKLLELRSRIELPVALPVSHRKVTVVLDLPTVSSKPLWDGFDSNVRRRVRRSMKEGIVVRFGIDLIDDFYKVFQEHMRDLGTPTHGSSLFRNAVKAFPDAWVGVAYLNDVPIAGIVGFAWGTEFEVTWASALMQHKQIAANMHVYWAFMERCIEQGITLFNFGRCSPDSGTHRFKLQWGSRDETLWWYQLRQAGLEDAGTPSPEGKYAEAVKLWQKLPLPVANLLGPHIVRGIP